MLYNNIRNRVREELFPNVSQPRKSSRKSAHAPHTYSLLVTLCRSISLLDSIDMQHVQDKVSAHRQGGDHAIFIILGSAVAAYAAYAYMPNLLTGAVGQ